MKGITKQSFAPFFCDLPSSLIFVTQTLITLSTNPCIPLSSKVCYHKSSES